MESNLGLRFTAIFVVIGLSLLFVGLFQPNWGIDLQGGYTVTYGLEAEEDEGEPDQAQTRLGAITADRVQATIAVMNKRVNRLGLREIKFVPEGSDRIKVQIPGADQAEANRIKGVLTGLGVLEFRLVATDSELQQAGVNVAQEATRRQQMEEEAVSLFEQGKRAPEYRGPIGSAAGRFAWYYLEDEDRDPRNPTPPSGPGYYVKTAETDPAIVGADIGRVTPSQDPETGFPAVAFRVKAQSRGKMLALSQNNIGRQMAIILNNRINTAPSINDELSSDIIITGGASGFRTEEVRDLIATLQSGSLDLKPSLLSEDLIGPTLGEDAINRGGIAMLAGMIAILVFMLVYYRAAGIIACGALLLTLLIMAGSLMLFSATLTLPGIAGVVLTVGMAVDANILIFERIREERDKGKTLLQSVKNGYEQAFRAIFDSNVTTLATAIILFSVGTEVIKGFGVTLAIGILSSMFSALFATKTIFLFLIQKGALKQLSMMKLVGVPKIEFLRYSGLAFALSLALVIGGLAIFFAQGDDKYSIEFTGGEVVQVTLKEPVSINDMKTRVTGIQGDGGAKYPDAEVVSIIVPGMAKGESTRFEISSKVDPDAGGQSFQQDIVSMLEGELLPQGVPYVEQLPEAGEGTVEGFEGGFRFGLTLAASMTDAEVRERLTAVSLDADTLTIEPDAARTAPLGGDWTVRTVTGRPIVANLDNDTLTSEVRKAFTENQSSTIFPEPIPKSTTIGKVVAKDLKNKAIIAIFLSLVFMIYYIRIRFHEYRYGLAAAVCLLHDVIVTLGICVLANSVGIVDVKISYAIIAVFLTIVGYSLNDTIVIFDRVRENIKKAKGSFVDTINQSICQTLSRTILTSLTTLFVVVVLLVVNYGQKSQLEGFAFALLVGIISGTYSTIYVASPVVVRIGKYIDNKEARAKSSGSAAAA